MPIGTHKQQRMLGGGNDAGNDLFGLVPLHHDGNGVVGSESRFCPGQHLTLRFAIRLCHDDGDRQTVEQR